MFFFQERRLAQQKIEDLQTELIEKEKEIEQYKYKLKLKADELDREKQERTEETVLLTHEIDNLKYMKNAAISQYDEHNDLLKQMELIKRVRVYSSSCCCCCCFVVVDNAVVVIVVAVVVVLVLLLLFLFIYVVVAIVQIIFMFLHYFCLRFALFSLKISSVLNSRLPGPRW